MQITELVPDPEVLVGLSTEEVAFQLLNVAQANLQNGMVHRDTIISTRGLAGQAPPYSGPVASLAEEVLIEFLHWLEINTLILPSTGTNGNNGWRFIGHRGRSLLDKAAFDSFRSAADFPKSLLHEIIADHVWVDLSRGEYATAVFNAFRTVEDAVRNACNYEAAANGVPMMRNAFRKEEGPLTGRTLPIAEQEALANLFAGAIGSYKNPHSHRTVEIQDHKEAQEMVMLASHLIRIIESKSSESILSEQESDSKL